jgi:hypothetical protein
MKTIIVLTSLILVVSFAVAAFAAQEQIGMAATATAVKRTAVTAQITAVQKNAIKTTLKSYFTPVKHGYGIGFTEDTYITAKWYVTQVRVLNRANVNTMIREAKQGNVTDWDAVRERVRTELASAYTTARKGRIRIEGINYLLTNIVVSDESITADIREIPDYSVCKEANTTAEACEDSSDKVGEITISKRTKPEQEIAGEPSVWAGTMTYNNVEYTFVTFAYPR